MKRKLPLLFGAVFLAFAAGACEGPQGPEGPAGPQGPEGPQGPAGEDGQDGTNALNTCSDCHSSDATLVAIEKQYDASKHGSGDTFERDGGSCTECHTHQGFIAAVVDGAPISSVAQPAPVNCRTCHQIHMTYEGPDGTGPGDYALTSTGEVTLKAGGTFDITTLDDGVSAAGNLCANCHQARDDGLDLSGATTTVSSFRAGYHHGTQANVLSGQTAEDLPGFPMPTSGAYASHVQFGCDGCHMQEPYGAQAGGHTWDMRYIYHGAEAILVPGGDTCAPCHDASADDPFSGQSTQVDVEALLVTAADLLRAQGIMEAAPSTYALLDRNAAGDRIPTDFDTDLVKAFLNFKLVEEDYSMGVHNPAYVKGVLNATIDYLNTLP